MATDTPTRDGRLIAPGEHWDPRVDPTPLPVPGPNGAVAPGATVDTGALPHGGYALDPVGPETGHAGGPRMPRIEKWLDVPGYPGFRFRSWINAPGRLFDQLGARDEAATIAAVRQLIQEHNGWCDADGEPLLAAQDEGFLDALSPHLFHSAIAAIRDEQRSPLAPPSARRSAPA